MRHPHADIAIKFFNDTSLVVQWRDPVDVNFGWEDCTETPCWSPDFEYRFKPEPKPDVVRYCIFIDALGDAKQRHYHNAKLTFDGETGKLKAAEIIE